MSSDEGSSDEESEATVDIYLDGGEVIRGCVVITRGKTFETLGQTTTAVALADTSVVACPAGARYRCVRVSDGGTTQHHATTAEQEESLIGEAAKAAGIKMAFTRWAQMVRSGSYPAEASAAERALFGECMLSQRCLQSRANAKRERDAESRRKRAKRHRGEPVDEQPAPAQPGPAAAVEITVRGTPSQVSRALRALGA